MNYGRIESARMFISRWVDASVKLPMESLEKGEKAEDQLKEAQGSALHST